MKAIVTSASEVNQDGTQDVAFDVTDDNGKVLVSHSLHTDVEQVKDAVKDFLRAYKQKAVSNKRVKVGDSWEV